MKIPKTYHGIPIVIPDKTPKYKKNSIATADSTGDGKPVIKIWKEHKDRVTPSVLAHEAGHIKCGHHNREGKITKGEYARDEKKAEKYAYKVMGGKGSLPAKRLANVIKSEILDQQSKQRQDYIYSHWDNFRQHIISNSSKWGFTKDEMKRGVDYIYEHISYRKITR